MTFSVRGEQEHGFYCWRRFVPDLHNFTSPSTHSHMSKIKSRRINKCKNDELKRMGWFSLESLFFFFFKGLGFITWGQIPRNKTESDATPFDHFSSVSLPARHWSISSLHLLLAKQPVAMAPVFWCTNQRLLY